MYPELDQVVNIDTRQNHWETSTTSDLLFRSVAANHGSSIWHGMIYVDPIAQQTDAYQTNNNLILDDSANVKSIPGLRSMQTMSSVPMEPRSVELTMKNCIISKQEASRKKKPKSLSFRAF